MLDSIRRRIGVTRVADLTQLDTAGIPICQAIRPSSRSLSVSQGKGATPELARISAIMEAVELWHAENAGTLLPSLTARLSEMEANMTYDIAGLPQSSASVFHPDLPISWVPGRTLLSDMQTLVPERLVDLSFDVSEGWVPETFFASSCGIAAGNTYSEAILHGLYEVLERDATARAVESRVELAHIDPAPAGSSEVLWLLDRLANANINVSVLELPSPTGFACCMAHVVSDDYPLRAGGVACAADPAAALYRAIIEAVQSRMTYISGARDDLDLDLYDDVRLWMPQRAIELPAAIPGFRTVGRSTGATDTIEDELNMVAQNVAATFGTEPVIVDYSCIGVPVVKVIVPGAKVTDRP